MPVRKGTLDRSLGRKALDGAKYVGKNFWKVLPIGHEINFLSGKSKIKSGLAHLLFTILWICPLGVYVLNGTDDGKWTPKQYKEARLEKQEQEQYRNDINNSYKKLFKDAKDVGDTLEIVNKHNILYELTLKPSFEDKERIVKDLEGSVE